ncbi:hypothetical protein BCR44DRAFT_1432005, partial [Catenaria anguillulae PL171]
MYCGLQPTHKLQKGGSKKEETRTQLLQNEHHKQARGEGRQVAVGAASDRGDEAGRKVRS